MLGGMATTLPTAPQHGHPTSYRDNITASNSSYAHATLQIQQQNYQTSPSHNWQTTHNCTTLFLRRLMLSLIMTFALIVFIILIAWLILHPQLPVFQIKSLSILNFNSSKIITTTTYDVILTVKNPNRKIDLYFTHSNLSLYSERKQLSTVGIDPFYLKKMNQTGWTKSLHIKLKTNSSWNNQTDEKTAVDMCGEESKGGVVINFNLKIQVCAKFVAGDWLSKQRSMEVNCKDLKVGFNSANLKTGELISGKDCFVH